MEIVILDADTLGSDIDISIFEKYGKVTVYGKTSKEQTIERVKNAQIIITNKVLIDKNVMYNSDKLKLICVAATGMNNIDQAEAKERNIIVKNVANYSTNSVVQHTFSLLFYINSSLNYFDNFVKSKEWSNSSIFTNVQQSYDEICGKKWGIIGLGNIGSSVAKIASEFGCDICYYSTIGENNNQQYKQATLKELLQTCDIVSIHSPLNDKTKDLISTDELVLLKNGAILLNLGRGGIVNEEAIAKEIDKREIFYATDVTAIEPLPNDSIFFSVQNKQRLFITPHIAWASKQSRERLILKIAQNIETFINH